MRCHTQFVVRNDSPKAVTLNVEPEGVFFALGAGEEVRVCDAFTTDPVTLKLTTSDVGDPILSIWPGDGDVRVEKNGVELFDLIQKEIGV